MVSLALDIAALIFLGALALLIIAGCAWIAGIVSDARDIRKYRENSPD
jgi:hypothetical protein